MSELSMVIEDLRKCANTLNETANWLTEMFSGDEPDAKEASANSPEPVLTLEAVRAILADMSRKGYTTQIRSLLQTCRIQQINRIKLEIFLSLFSGNHDIKPLINTAFRGNM